MDFPFFVWPGCSGIPTPARHRRARCASPARLTDLGRSAIASSQPWLFQLDGEFLRLRFGDSPSKSSYSFIVTAPSANDGIRSRMPHRLRCHLRSQSQALQRTCRSRRRLNRPPVFWQSAQQHVTYACAQCGELGSIQSIGVLRKFSGQTLTRVGLHEARHKRNEAQQC